MKCGRAGLCTCQEHALTSAEMARRHAAASGRRGEACPPRATPPPGNVPSSAGRAPPRFRESLSAYRTNQGLSRPRARGQPRHPPPAPGGCAPLPGAAWPGPCTARHEGGVREGGKVVYGRQLGTCVRTEAQARRHRLLATFATASRPRHGPNDPYSQPSGMSSTHAHVRIHARACIDACTLAHAHTSTSRNSTAERISQSTPRASCSVRCTAAKSGQARKASCTDLGRGAHWMATAVTTPAPEAGRVADGDRDKG